MRKVDTQLYEYMIERVDYITDDWLAKRTHRNGSIYSARAGNEIENMLREQNKLTILTVTSSLLDDPSAFDGNKKKWANIVAKSRVQSNTPIPEVLEALSHVREAYWQHVRYFYEASQAGITIEDFIRWGNIINMAFDQVLFEFAKAYNHFYNKKFVEQQDLINELSSPIIKVNERIGVVPLIGNIDDVRANVILEYIPEKCNELDVQHLFIDLSGVMVVDTMVAQQIYTVTQILELLGIRSTITGIRPEIAQASTELGLDFSGVETFSSLQQALKKQFSVVSHK